MGKNNEKKLRELALVRTYIMTVITEAVKEALPGVPVDVAARDQKIAAMEAKIMEFLD